MLCNLRERQTPRVKVHLLCKTKTESNCPQQHQSEKQRPEFLPHFKVLAFGALRSLACSWLLPISGSLLEATGHVDAKATWPMERRTCINLIQVLSSEQRAREPSFVPLGLF